MNSLRSAALTVILAGIAAILSLPSLVARTPDSLASLALGTDDAFAAEGLEPRENQIGGGALRWTRPRAVFTFADLGPGFVDIELQARDHRSEVTITANGARIGTLRPGERLFSSRTRLSGSALALGIETDGFAASGRTLGTQVVALRVGPASAGEGVAGNAVPPRLWMALGAVLLTSGLAQWVTGQSVLMIIPAPVLFLFMVVPAGLWRSAWLIECALLFCVAASLSAFVSARARGSLAARGWLQAAVLSALTIHGVLPPSPLIIQGDVQLHGNKLGEVARGNLSPTSRTDHKPPFEIPYGFSFYAALTPFVSPGVSNVKVVREGAALFSALSLLGLALVLGRTSAVLAAASVALWTFAPVNIRTMAFGNLSNVFAQAVFLLFLVVAGIRRPGRATFALLTLLAAFSATAHLSSFIVLFTLLLAAFFVAADRRSPAFAPLLCGVALSAAYFATFLPMIAAQLPRLLGERGGSGGVFDPWRLPLQIVAGLGGPLVVLIVLALARRTLHPVLPLTRSLFTAGLVLALAALVSPVEVRYLLALAPLLAIAGASVYEESPRSLRPLTFSVLLAAVVHGVMVLVEFLPLCHA